jgi:hypothetical protein
MGGFWAIAIIAIGFLVFGIAPALVAGAGNKKEVERINTSGLNAEAKILSYGLQKSKYGAFRAVRFSFTPQGQTQPIAYEKCIYSDREFVAGTLVNIKYSPNFPALSVLEPYGTKQNASSTKVA